MARPRSENPRHEQLNIRLNTEEAAGVDAVVFLHTPNNNKAEWFRELINTAVAEARAADPRVEELIQFRIAARVLTEPATPPAD